VATDYKKKQFVFRLKTADWAEYLFQTSNSNELYDWISTINLVASMFSSPPLPGGIGSNKTFQRPLLPVSKTRYTLQEQFEYHKKHLKHLQADLARLESTVGASHSHHHHHHNNHHSTNHQHANNNNSSNSNNNNSNNVNSSNNKEDKSFDKDKYNYLQFEVNDQQKFFNTFSFYHHYLY
jgi:hypothetical protein